MFCTLIDIDSELNGFIKEIEKYYAIKIAQQIINQIITDSQENQVDEKNYDIFKGENRLLKKSIVIVGRVDEFEPETIWIEINNIKKGDEKHFQELINNTRSRVR